MFSFGTKNYLCQFHFLLDNSFYFQVEMLLNDFIIFKLRFSMTHFFASFAFYIHYRHLLSNYNILLLIQQNFLRFPRIIHLSLIQLFSYFFLQAMVCLIHNLKYQTLFKHLQQCLCKYHLFLCIQ